LREVARWRLSLRTVIAVLRKRQAGLPFDPAREGVGPLTSLMVANWSRPDLGLGAVFPWVARLAELLQRERTKDVERFIFRTVWEELSLRGFRHTFDFEAVAFYVLKWDLVYRATHEDEGLATVRFRELLDSSGASPDLSAWAEG